MYTPRPFVKDGLEQVAGSVAHEVRLKFAGWVPKADPPAQATQAQSAAPSAEPDPDAAVKTTTRRKPATPPTE